MRKQCNVNNIILAGFLLEQLKSTILLYFATYKKSFQKTVKVIFYLHLGFFLSFAFVWQDSISTFATVFAIVCVSSYSDFLAFIEFRRVGSSEVLLICFPTFERLYLSFFIVSC
jgi:hypothetical protein